ncbi:hypothetical protein HDU80_009354 [Chytriomyces hyalinus]|nr:hypothetical protein HDU80_009354 [Chytriomyces hyalinus]
MRPSLLILTALVAVSDTHAAAASSTLSVPCKTDGDCAALTSNLGTNGVAAFLCVDSFCSVAVAAGQTCSKASDCAQYHWTQRRLGSNAGNESLSALCAPQYCTIASDSCCAGGAVGDTCASFGTAGTNPKTVSTCSPSTSCRASSDSSTDLFCSLADQKSTLWIGIVISIFGAAANNIGLNLQKLALRRRSEEEDAEKKETQIKKLKIGALKNFPGSWSSHLKKGWNSLRPAKAYSDVTVEGQTSSPVVAKPDLHLSGTDIVSSPLAAPGQTSSESLNSTSGEVTVEQITTRVTQSQEHLPISIVNANSQDSAASDLDKKLNFGNLVKNPIWVLGMGVYILANLVNFAALQFAPQSLVAPLGSISLVVNIIAAPYINNESWTWKDIVGSVFIVGGSSMTVVFAGVSSQDYNICILLKLFRRIPTIIFLCVTLASAISFFVYICIIEKNVDKQSAPSATTLQDDTQDTPGEITITTTTTTVTIPPSPRNPSRRPISTSYTTNEFQMTQLQPLNATPTAPVSATSTRSQWTSSNHLQQHRDPLPKSPIMGAALESQNSVLEWTGSLYSRVYMNAGAGGAATAAALPMKDRVSRLLNSGSRAGTPVTGSNEMSGSRVSIGGAASNEVGPLGMKDAGSKILSEEGGATAQHNGLHVDTNTNQDSVVDPHSIVQKVGEPTSEFKISDDIGPRVMRRSIVAGLMGGSGTASATTVGDSRAERDEDTDSVTPDMEDSFSDRLKAKEKESWVAGFKRRLYNALPAEVRKWLEALKRVELVPRFQRKYKVTDKVVAIGLPISYAALGGLMGTTTTLFAKSTIHLLTNSFLGDNQFNSIYSWMILGVTVFTAFAQVYWINMGLQRYDALLQIPVFFVVWTLFDVVGGGVYFDEFSGFTPRQYGLFILAIGVIFFGVFVLGDRLKKTHV